MIRVASFPVSYRMLLLPVHLKRLEPRWSVTEWSGPDESLTLKLGNRHSFTTTRLNRTVLAISRLNRDLRIHYLYLDLVLGVHLHEARDVTMIPIVYLQQ